MPRLLSHSEIEAAMARVPGWTLDEGGKAITRRFSLATFPAALTFSCAVGHLAERADHHPDFLIQYKNVTLTLSTHSAGGLTENDFKLAGQINSIAD